MTPRVGDEAEGVVVGSVTSFENLAPLFVLRRATPDDDPETVDEFGRVEEEVPVTRFTTEGDNGTATFDYVGQVDAAERVGATSETLVKGTVTAVGEDGSYTVSGERGVAVVKAPEPDRIAELSQKEALTAEEQAEAVQLLLRKV